MFIAVKHTVTDPEKFFGDYAKQFLSTIPKEITLHNSYALEGGKEVICVWEADSIDRLRNFMDPQTKDIAKNEYAAVDSQRSLNLPAARRAA